MGNAVRIIGARSRDEVARAMSAAHLFAAPSVTARDGDMEGIPVALMEAMASGVPVVATRHSGIPELVEDKVTGLLVPERDTDSLAAAFRWLVDHPERWMGIALAAHDAVERNFNGERLNDELVTLLEHVGGREPREVGVTTRPRIVPSTPRDEEGRRAPHSGAPTA